MEKDRRTLHFSKEITLGDALTVLTLLIGVVSAWFTLSGRVDILSEAFAAHKAEDKANDHRTSRAVESLSQKFDSFLLEFAKRGKK